LRASRERGRETATDKVFLKSKSFKETSKRTEMTRRRKNPGSTFTTLSAENSYGNNTHIGSKTKQTRDETQMLAIQQGIFLFSRLVFSLQTIKAQKQLPERNTAEKLLLLLLPVPLLRLSATIHRRL
jgi:hypothetical protein